MTSVRAAVPADADAVLALERHCFGAGAWSPGAVDEAASGVAHRWMRVVEAGGQVVGYVIGVPAGDVLDLARVAVAPGCRGAGRGEALVGALLAHAADAGFERVLLEVGESEPARRLYERMGFHEIGRRRGYYTDGQDAVVMQTVVPGASGWTGGTDD